MRHWSFSPRLSASRERLLGERAAQMRQAPTASEARLFQALRGRRLGVSFRRQVPLLGRYIVDLLAPELQLVIEIDGLYHARRRAADARRERALVRAGYHVLRLDAAVVVRDVEAAVLVVQSEVERLREQLAPP